MSLLDILELYFYGHYFFLLNRILVAMLNSHYQWALCPFFYFQNYDQDGEPPIQEVGLLPI